jgi:hypothetical protein
MNTVSLKTLGDWQKKIAVPLNDVLAVSMDICGRTGAEACKHAMILMAQSARAITPKAPPRRPIASDVHTHAEYVTTYKKDGTNSRVFKFMFGDPKRGGAGATLEGTWAQAQKIANRGLAARSWMWGLKKFGVASAGKPMGGVTTLMTITGEKACGYILTDRIKYLLKIMPAGWESTVAQRAGNKIMKQAAMKIERQWKSEMARSRRAGAAVGKNLARYFLRAA